jgi:hypothetical protein
MEAANVPETSINFYHITRHNNTEDSRVQTRRCENVKSHYWSILQAHISALATDSVA